MLRVARAQRGTGQIWRARSFTHQGTAGPHGCSSQKARQQSSGASTSSNTVNPAQFAQYQGNYGNAQNVAAGLSTPYSGSLTAPFTPTQIQAQNLLSSVAANPQYQNQIAGAANAVTGIMNNPVSTIVLPQPVTAPTIAGTNLAPYMNPYQSSVVNATLGQLGQLNANQLMNTNQGSTAAGAFGGSRSGVADALTNQYDMQAAAPTIAGLNASNFTNAQNLAGQDANTLNAMAQFNSGQNVNAQQSSIANALSAQNAGLNAANALAGLAGQGYSLAATQGGLLGSVGQQQQTQNQTALTNAYNAWAAQQSQNAQAQGLLNSSLGIIPVQQTTNSSSTGNSSGTTETTTSPSLTGILGSIANLGANEGGIASGISALAAL